jgi:hypothetical protein
MIVIKRYSKDHVVWKEVDKIFAVNAMSMNRHSAIIEVTLKNYTTIEYVLNPGEMLTLYTNEFLKPYNVKVIAIDIDHPWLIDLRILAQMLEGLIPLPHALEVNEDFKLKCNECEEARQLQLKYMWDKRVNAYKG